MTPIRNNLRKLSEFLSFPHNMKYETLTNKQNYLLNFLAKKINSKKNENLKKLKTHEYFNKKVEFFIKNKKLDNFLRINIIQNIFFIHNRFYLVLQLLALFFSSNWYFWKKLLLEKSIGNPVPFFFYRKTSGNRIRHLYHLKTFFEYYGFRNYDYVIEIGGGYGCMCDIFKGINKKTTYIIFDTFEVNLLQYYYLKSLNYNVSLNRYNSNIMLISDINLFKKIIISLEKNTKKLLISNWGLSEFPVNLRIDIMSIVSKCNSFLISFQKQFEKIDNLFFFKNFFLKYNNKYSIKFIKIHSMNLLKFTNQHYYLFGNKKK
jgi:hypothetical protein